jgi:NADPH:quinone reductase
VFHGDAQRHLDDPRLIPDRLSPERCPADGVRRESTDLPADAFQRYVDLMAAGKLPIRIDRVFVLDEIAAAHRIMQDGKAAGKLVVRVR